MDRIISPQKLGDTGSVVANLHAALDAIAAQGLLGLSARELMVLNRTLSAERGAQSFGAVTGKLVALFQQTVDLQTDGAVDAKTASAMNAALERLGLLDPVVPPRGARWTVSGTVQSPDSAAVAGLTVAVLDKGIGGDQEVARLQSGESGFWSVGLDLAPVLKKRGKDRPDLQARVYLGDTLLGESPVLYDADENAVLDIALNGAASAKLASEYEALIGELTRRTPLSLAALQENDQRQDITWLANKTGWDARAVALATLASRMAEQDDALDAAWYYAAMRAGLPPDRQELLRTDPARIRAVWADAIDAGVVPREMKDKLDEAVDSFAASVAVNLLDGAPANGISTVRQLLPDSMKDEKDQLQYARLVTSSGGDTEKLGKQLQDTFGKERAEAIEQRAQLAVLTRNNAPLIARLERELGAGLQSGPIALVDGGLDRAEGWADLIGNDVPDDLPGADRAARMAAYAEGMAAQVRLAFPTAVMSRMVGAGEIPLSDKAARSDVQKFLRDHAASFNIGDEPVGAFVRANKIEAVPDVLAEVSRIQRVYQITPDAKAISALLGDGLGSATEVMAYSPTEFSAKFGEAVGGEAVAARIYGKAEQVHGTVLNLAASYLALRNAPQIGFQNANVIISPVQPPGNISDVLAYGTLESVFGEMDYCACDHCRSVLSPAAYLVDLLMFIDAPPARVPAGTGNPQAVLLARRPDIERLPLSCENTNTPIPYIDLVNETLEYFVAQNLSLEGFEGYTTDPQIPEAELLASPQNVRAGAYQRLAEAVYPPPLPFNHLLELHRRLFANFDASLATVMEEMRPSDQLERGAQPYGYRDIRLERLGLSRAESRLLMRGWPDAGPADPLQTAARLFGMGATSGEATVRGNLTNAKAFASRSGLTYEELARILRTRFVNPDIELLPMLERLGVGFGGIAALANGSLPTLSFAAGVDPADYGGDIRGWLTDPARLARIMGLIVLTDTDPAGASADFGTMELRYSDPDPARTQLRLTEFIRIGRFIRLWRKLGWSIEETDAALSALWDASRPGGTDDAARLAALDAGFLDVLPRMAVLVEAMSELKLNRSRDLAALLTLFGPMGTLGPESLYARLFLNRLDVAQAFRRDRNGAVLNDPAARLLDHIEDLRGAFGLRAAEIATAVAALGFTAATPLDLASVSALFRHGWLARRLGLSVEELVALNGATGLDPFGLPDPVAPGLLGLIRLIAAMRAAKLAPAKALALLWNRTFQPADDDTEPQILDLARQLRGGLAAVEAIFLTPAQPGFATARSLLSLAYPAAATDQFMAALEGSTALAVAYDHTRPDLEDTIVAAGRGRIGYDDFSKRLTFSGALSESVSDDLKAVPGTSAVFDAAVDALYGRSRQTFGALFAEQPELGPLYDDYLDSTDPIAGRLAVLFSAILPDLTDRARRAQAIALAAANGSVDPALAQALLTDAARLHAAEIVTSAGIEDLLALDMPGLSARFGDGVAGSAPFAIRAAVLPEFAPDRTPLPKPGGNAALAISVKLDGWIEAEVDGPCQIFVETDSGADVALEIAGESVAMVDEGGGLFSNGAPVSLGAGRLVRIRLTVGNVVKRLRLFWRLPGGGRLPVPGARLYPADLVEALRSTQLRLMKAQALSVAFGLPAAAMTLLADEQTLAEAGEGWVGRLAVRGAALDAAAPAFGNVLRALLTHARLRGMALDADRLTLALSDLKKADPVNRATVLAGLLGWDAVQLGALLTRLGAAPPDLADPAILSRVIAAMERAQALGIAVTDLLAAATNEPDQAASNLLSAALRARFAPADWQGTIKPVNDEMRNLRRDALVAWCLFQLGRNPQSAHIDSADKLFEYFLMDVSMQPCMLTSRIRNALSSVQMFIERCLMGLEANVSPESILPDRWAWMKRYRVWEANRKVFLFPENWLDPQLRDDQSPIFRDAMSELLQGDVTEERARRALTGYLTGLNEVANLQISGIFHELRSAGETPVIHVIGRTPGARRDYYYRKREAMQWSPWTRIRLDIEDDPVMPVVWQGRLFLFWLNIVQSPVGGRMPYFGTKTIAATEGTTLAPSTTMPQNNVHVILNWSELVDGEWQPSHKSNPDKPLYLTSVDGTGEDRLDRSKITLASLGWVNDGLRVSVSYVGVGSFFLHNPYSEPEQRFLKEAPHFAPVRSLDTAGNSFNIRYRNDFNTILRQTIDNDSAVGPNHPLAREEDSAGFFYQDARNSFYVTTERIASFLQVPAGVIGAIAGGGAATVAHLGTKWQDLPIRYVIKQPKKPGFGVVDPEPPTYRVTEDAHIGMKLQTGGTVAFDGIQIGPGGARIIIGKER